MRCRHCDYPLWNIKARVCPECGNAFKPSDYEFTPNSVRFLCPHCSQDYYGTTPDGHLEPTEFDCVRCGHHVRMDEMTLLPTEGVDERLTTLEVMPWRERAQIGFVRAWFATVGKALFAPTALMRADPGPSNLDAWWFLVLTQAAYSVVGFAALLFLMLFAVIATGGATGLAGMALWLVASLVGGAVFYSIFVAVWGAITHAILRVTGATERTIGATYQCLCYASGANAMTIVPCLGTYLAPVAWIWWTISAAFMVAERQRVSAWRAALAVGLPPGIAILLLAAAFGALMFGSVSRVQAAAGAMNAQAAATSARVAQAILAHNAEWGAEPRHAIELLDQRRIQPWDLQPGWSGTNPMNIPVGSADLQTFQNAGPAQRTQLAREAVAALPPGTIAHRLGDLVFTYHGIDLADPDPGLWLVIYWRDPFMNAAPPGFVDDTVIVGLADGTSRTIAPEDFPAALEEQNALRATHDLPPLPDPDTITHINPATAPN